MALNATELTIDPPFWFSGMTHDELQLLVHGEQIASFELKFDYPGVELIRIEKAPNPNYLFIYLKLGKDVLPGELEMVFSHRKRKIRKSFEIKARNSKEAVSGIDQNDLIYVLFPDRFSNGDPTNDRIKGMNEQSVNRDSMFYRHGGDIAGIRKHLDYLDHLGVTALWINPLIENDQPEESYHGYAATNLYCIDARFGSNEEYFSLSREADSKGIKMVMDVVLNHWGNEHWILKDLPDSSWINTWDGFQRTTYRATTLLDPYASDVDRKRMTDGWFDHHMPDLNQRNKLLADYLIQNHIWWIENAGIDALRIDTYAYPDQLFMTEWANRIKGEFPGISMFGETWVHGTPVQAWFVNDSGVNREYNSELESVTDFQLYYAINKALSEKEGWTEGSLRLYYTLAKDVLYEHPERLVTFVDNHDLSRFYSMVNEDLNSYKMGIGFMLTTRGIPSIYYGTEILMKNYADPDGKVREDFPGGWDGDPVNKFDPQQLQGNEKEAFDFIQKLANWRKNSGLMNGRLLQFVPEKGVYVYFRYTDNKAAMAILNFSGDQTKLELDRFHEMLGTDVKTGIDVLESLPVELNSTIELAARSFRLIEFNR